jgi:thiamine kinase-like enzyme
MTDYERKRRDECIKLRAQVERLKREVSALVDSQGRYSKAFDQLRIERDTWKEAHMQICQGQGKKT